MVNGAIKFTVENGNGPVSNTFKPPSPYYFCDNQWHRVMAVKNKNVVILKVDEQQTPISMDSGVNTATDTNNPLYVGGYPSSLAKSKDIEVDPQFVGCIKNLEINQKEEQLSLYTAYENLISCHGLEADRHLLRCLFSEIDFNSDSIRTPNNKDFQQVQLLTQECSVLLGKPALVSVLCFAVDRALQQENFVKNPSQLLTVFSKIIKLSSVQEVVFGLTLLHSSNQEIADSALQFVKLKLPSLIKSYIEEDNKSSKLQEGGLHEATPQVIHFILTYLFSAKDLFGINFESKELFLHSLRRDFPRELVPVVLSPLLYPNLNFDLQFSKMSEESTAMANTLLDDSLPNLIMEMGYGFCSNIEDGRQNMNSLHLRDLPPAVVAKILIMMVRTHTGLDDLAFWTSADSNKEKNINENQMSSNSWNIEIFVQLLKEFSANTLWIDVIRELDNGELLLKDRIGLSLLMSALKLGLQSQGYPIDRFPVDLLYRPWKYSESQFTLINQILKNSDIFSFADYNFHPVLVDMLKSTPESDNKDIATWRSLDLIDLLMHLADRGLITQVQEIMKYPVQHCPDFLSLGLLQTNQPMTLFKQELLSNLIPIFLANHANSTVILHHLWHNQNIAIKQLLIQSMADWYVRGESDQTRLSRILDIAHDLKALSLLLNSPSLQFSIDLACLASRREYLKLEKWLSDKVRDQGEVFVSALIKFLQRRCNQFVSGSFVKDESHPKAAQLPQETIVTILGCLQVCAGNVNPENAEGILTLIANCNLLMNKSRPAPPGVLRTSTFNPNQIFSTAANAQVDSITNLGTSLSNINLNASQTNNSFSLPASLGPLVSATGSPSRLISLSQNTSFPLLPQLSGAIGSQVSHGPSTLVGNSVVAVNNLSRVIPQNQAASIEKSRLVSTGDNALSSNPADLNCQVSKEIEDEANSYFQRIYNHPPHPTLSIDEILDLLKKFQDSPNKREREIYSCMIRNLFEEYKFFPQYPDKELHVTAQLFGGILSHGLVPQGALFGIGIRYIVDALRKPSNSKIFAFGIAALDQFKYKLKEVPKLCEYVMSLPNFSEFPPYLVELIEYGVQGADPPSKPQTISSNVVSIINNSGVATSSFKTISMTSSNSANVSPVAKLGTPTRPSIANATNIDTLLGATEKDEKMIIPPESLQDKIAFTFNNLSQMNLVVKCEELRELIREEHYQWLAQYLVMKRASIEQNFHVLYSNFLDCLKIKEFHKLILAETYRHWLGMMTLAKNKPVLMDDLDIKLLLLESHQKGQHEMLYIVPFVAKILESCSKSRIFKPPNPWTISVMCILAEIHQEPDLKLNLKFEIEVLCKNLQIELKPPISSIPVSNVSAVFTSIVSTSSTSFNTPMSSVSEEIVGMPQLSNSLQTVGIPQLPNSIQTPPLMPPPVLTPEPKFNLISFNITSIQNLGTLITINNQFEVIHMCNRLSQLPLFQAHPQLKQCVRPAFERAVQEWLAPIVDRSVKIAVNTSEQIVKKDFALDPDESRVRAAAHYMVRNLAAGMAMITCREQIISSFNQNLKTAILNIVVNPTTQQKEMIEQAANACVNDNLDLACAFIQKSTVDKAVVEVDRHLLSEYERRKNARSEGRRYCDSGVLTYQAERMPEQVRLKVGGVTPQQMAVYEEFARNIPGFQPMTDKEAAMCTPKSIPQFSGASDEMGALYDKITSDLEIYLQNMMNQNVLGASLSNCQMNISISSLIDSISIHRRSRDPNTAVIVIQKAVDGLLECMNQDDPDLSIRYRDFYLRIMKVFQDPRSMGLQWTNKQITKALIECREEYRYNSEVVDLLVRSRLINLPMFDTHLIHSMENGANYVAVSFAMQIVQHYLVEDRNSSLITEQDLACTIDALVKLATHSRNPPEGLVTLIEILRMSHDNSSTLERTPLGATAYIHSGILQVKTREIDDPPGLLEKTEYLLREWVHIYQTASTNKDPSKAFTLFVHQMNVHGILKTDDLITRFFRLSTQLVVDLCFRLLQEPVAFNNNRMKVFQTLDAFVKLIALLVKHSGDSANTNTKLNLLNKVLEFQQLPYHRIFSMLFIELNSTDQVLESMNYPILQAFSHTMHILRPCKCAGFSFAWLEIISHRVFLGRVLTLQQQQKGWCMYAQLLVDLFKFLAPYLRNTNLTKSVTTMYKGALKVLLVLLHDFPEFLCEYHYGFCDVIPPNCIQMRNLILSAFPRNMRLPDPFTPNLKVDMLAEITQAPRIQPSYVALIQPVSFRKDLDNYLKTRAPVTFLSELKTNLQTSTEPGIRYNIPLLNALVLYIGAQAIIHIRNKGQTPNMSTIAHSAHMDIYQNLSTDLDTEGRYLFLNAIANQLRYPNSHTHYFSCTLLYLFAEANSECIQEQITRVLLERIIVNRPHPWGLLITFIELIKNPIYRFWSHEFVHCAAEIEKLFESVARSCMVPPHLIHGSAPSDSD
ncbi:hypothetical protein PGB90_000849 [Kerria lacca]